MIMGFSLWIYLQGPWIHDQDYAYPTKKHLYTTKQSLLKQCSVSYEWLQKLQICITLLGLIPYSAARSVIEEFMLCEIKLFSTFEEGKLVACLYTSMAALPWIYPLQLCFGHVTGSPCWEHCIQAVEQTNLSVRQSLRSGILNSFSLHVLSGGAANETGATRG